MSRKQPPFRAGEPMRGLSASGSKPRGIDMGASSSIPLHPMSQDGLGEYVGNPEFYQSAPGDIGVPFKAEIKGRPVSAGGMSKPIPKREVFEQGSIPLFRNMPIPGRNLVITPTPVDAGKTLKIDQGIAGRFSILIWNVSTVVFWINTTSAVRAPGAVGVVGNGLPLGPASAAGAYNGGAVMFEAGPEIEFYAVPQSGSQRYIIVAEIAR